MKCSMSTDSAATIGQRIAHCHVWLGIFLLPSLHKLQLIPSGEPFLVMLIKHPKLSVPGIIQDLDSADGTHHCIGRMCHSLIISSGGTCVNRQFARPFSRSTGIYCGFLLKHYAKEYQQLASSLKIRYQIQIMYPTNTIHNLWVIALDVYLKPGHLVGYVRD